MAKVQVMDHPLIQHKINWDRKCDHESFVKGSRTPCNKYINVK